LMETTCSFDRLGQERRSLRSNGLLATDPLYPSLTYQKVPLTRRRQPGQQGAIAPRDGQRAIHNRQGSTLCVTEFAAALDWWGVRMLSTLLATNLHRPRPTSNLVARPRLNQHPGEGLSVTPMSR